MSDQESPKITRYLLGQLPAEEMDALEARLLTESGLFELAESVEDEVVDRYVRGELSAEERRRFERLLLPSDRIQERVEFARALAARDAAHGSAPPARRGAERTGGTVVAFFRSPVRLAWAATLVAALAAGALAVEVVRLRGAAVGPERIRIADVESTEPEPVAQEPELAPAAGAEDERLAAELAAARERIAELEAQGAVETERRVRRPGDFADDAATLSVFLSLATRAGEVKAISLDDAERLELQLDLGGRRPSRPVAVLVARDGHPVWRESGLPVEQSDGESMARLVLPRESLLEGRYRIELAEGEVGDAGDLLGTYEISITR